MAKNQKFYTVGREVSLIEGLKPMGKYDGVTLLPQMVFTGKLKIVDNSAWLKGSHIKLRNNFWYTMKMLKLIPQKKWIIVDKMDKKQFMGHIPQKYSTTQMANGAPPSSGISSSTGAPAAS